MEFNLTIFEGYNRLDVLSSNQHRLKWPSVVAGLTKLRVADDKAQVKMFTGAEFKPNGRRQAEDLLDYSLLVLDFDETVHYNWFISTYSDYAFILYTSWNHCWNKQAGEVDREVCRFRVILPLKSPANAEKYRQARPALKKMFPDADPASFAISQAFYLPSCPPDREQLFFSFVSRGKALDLDELWADAIIAQAQAEIDQPFFSFNGENTLEDAERVLGKVSADLPYTDWIKVGSCLREMFGDAAQDLWVRWSMSGAKCDQNELQLQRKYSGLSTEHPYGFGFLVNKSKEFSNE